MYYFYLNVIESTIYFIVGILQSCEQFIFQYKWIEFSCSQFKNIDEVPIVFRN